MAIVLKYLKGKRLKYLGSMLAIILTAYMDILEPLIIRTTIDSVIGTRAVDVKIGRIFYLLGGREHLLANLWILALLLLGVAIIKNISRYIRGIWSSQGAEHFAKEIKDDLYNHIQHLPYETHIKVKSGEFIQRSTSDIETIRRFLNKQFIDTGRIITMIVLTLIAMIQLNLKLALLSTMLVPIIAGGSMYFFFKVKDVFEKSDEAEASMTSAVNENLSGIRVVRAFGKQEFEKSKFDRKNRAFKDSRIRLITLLSVFWSFSDLLCFLQLGIVLVSGIYMTLNNTISLGTLVAFIFYSERLIWPIGNLGRILSDAGQGSIALKRINEIFNMKVEDLEGVGSKEKIRGNIDFEKVSFSYDGGVDILKDISFKVRAGETIAILGETGSGKSTLMHLLVRLFDLKKGRILIDGIDIKDINKKHLRRSVGIILQEAFLFSKTIKENIKITNRKIEEKAIYRAASFANIHDVIKDFKDGYDTMVGEQGVTLSGGQKQRVSIARTIINNSRILIFDDSLSALDSKTDANIREALKKREGKTTTFIISHRISTLSQADRIIVLSNGRVESIGTHSELINKDGLYKTTFEIEKSKELNISA